MASPLEYVATVLFAIAIVHTFSVPVFARLANKGGNHAGLWHMLSEVEAVFGVWACVLVAYMAVFVDLQSAIEYLEGRNFTEPMFVFAIMVVAASRPILELVNKTVSVLARALPMSDRISTYFITISVVPLAGSLITEPAAMTLAALLLHKAYFRQIGRASCRDRDANGVPWV